MKSSSLEPLLSPEEVAALLNVPLATVYGWRQSGRGPRGHRVGKHVRYRRAAVEAWLERNADPDTAA